jgi:hypothetical protein
MAVDDADDLVPFQGVRVDSCMTVQGPVKLSR